MPNENGQTRCDRCGKVFNPYLGDRFWSGTWMVDADDGSVDIYNTLCNDCHRTVVRGS